MKKYILFILIIGSLPVFFVSCVQQKKKESISTDSVSIAKGRMLFSQHCSGCHNFNNDGIGPSLSGVTKRDTVEWLKKFIRDPKIMVASGDPRAKNLLATYHSMMPSFTDFKEEELDNLISYLHSQKEGKVEKPDPLAVKDPIPEKIEAGNVVLNLTLFAQIPASSDKEPLTRITKMEWIPSAHAWFILDQRGKLYKGVHDQPQVWLDVSKWKPHFINQPGLATGFGSFAFHPDFANNGIFYTTHTEPAHTSKADFAIPDSVNQTLQWVLCEWKISDRTSSEFKGTSRELMRVDMVAGIHGVQEIVFNPGAKKGHADYGQLYIGIGDGGAVENSYSFLTRHPDKIWGSILRIDPMGNNSSNGQYGISEKNPFAKTPSAAREIYAYGFRNPNRISWTKNGTMLATNIGQSNIEAIDMIVKGGNYGWPQREGRFMMHPADHINSLYPLPSNDSSFHFSYPVAVYDHDEGKAIAGGFEYTGKDVPQLTGKYLFGDIPTGRLFYVHVSDLKSGKEAILKEWFVSLNGKKISLRDLCGQSRVDLRFARDDKGEMYIFTKPDGKIYRLGFVP